jgi:hypothetical protein
LVTLNGHRTFLPIREIGREIKMKTQIRMGTFTHIGIWNTLSCTIPWPGIEFSSEKQLPLYYYYSLKLFNRILIYVQPDATLHSLFYLETALHVSGGTSTHHQERKQLYVQNLVFVTPLVLPAAIAVFCAPDDGWRYHPKHVEQFPDKINCVNLHLIGYILECYYDARNHER